MMSMTLTVLIVLVGVFIGLNYFQGPKLDVVIADTSSIASTSNQRVRLVASQTLARVEARQVRFEPAAKFTVTTSGTTIEIMLTEPLDFATDYTLTVSGVTSRYIDRAVTFTHSLRTPEAVVTFLDRADPLTEPGKEDAIRQVIVPDGDPVDLYRASGIEQFTRIGPSLLVVTSTPSGGGALDLIAEDGMTRERLLLGVDGVIGELQPSTTVGLVAFTVTAEVTDPLPRQSTVLYAVDLAGDHIVRAVTGLDGAPLEIFDSVIMPGGTLIAAQGVDETVTLVDLTGVAPAIPVGQFMSLRGVSPDGSQLLVGDIYSAITLTIADGTQTRLTIAPLNGTQPFIGDIVLTDQVGTRVEQLAIFDAVSGSFTSAIGFADDTQIRVIYETPGDSGSIDEFTVSPNGQYVAVATIPDVTSSVLDGAVADRRSTSIVTTIIEVATGREVRTVSGFDLSW